MNDQHDWRTKENWVWIPEHERTVKKGDKVATYTVAGHWVERRRRERH